MGKNDHDGVGDFYDKDVQDSTMMLMMNRQGEEGEKHEQASERPCIARIGEVCRRMMVMTMTMVMVMVCETSLAVGR